MRRLILFDIDGTLIRSNRVGSTAMIRAMETFTGSGDAMRRIDMAGQVDWGIWQQALAAVGYTNEEIEAHLPAIWRKYEEELSEILRSPDHPDPEVLPGVRPLLEALHNHDDILLGLLTGNTQAGARLKLGKVALDHYFPFGAFGDDAPERPALPPLAVQRAAAFAGGHHFTKKEIVIIGDTVHDMRCGASLGVCAIGVATGPVDTMTLLRAGADYAFDSFENHQALLDILLAGNGGKL